MYHPLYDVFAQTWPCSCSSYQAPPFPETMFSFCRAVVDFVGGICNAAASRRINSLEQASLSAPAAAANSSFVDFDQGSRQTKLFVCFLRLKVGKLWLGPGLVLKFFLTPKKSFSLKGWVDRSVSKVTFYFYIFKINFPLKTSDLPRRKVPIG